MAIFWFAVERFVAVEAGLRDSLTRMVKFRVLAMWHYAKIFRGIVAGIFVNMVDAFTGTKAPTNHGLSHHLMFVNFSSVGKTDKPSVFPLSRSSSTERDVLADSVMVGVSPKRFSSFGHFLLLFRRLCESLEMLPMIAAIDSKRDHSVSYRVAAYPKRIGNFLEWSFGIFVCQPYRVINAFVHDDNILDMAS
jgi:hypothetical protein